MCGSHEFTGIVKMVSSEDNYFLQQLDCDFEWSSCCISRFNYTFPNVCPSSSFHAFLCPPSPLTPGRHLGSTASQTPTGLYANQAWREKEEDHVYKAGLDERCSEEPRCNEGEKSCNRKLGRKEISLSFKLFLSSPYLTNWNKTPLKVIFPTRSARHWSSAWPYILCFLCSK